MCQGSIVSNTVCLRMKVRCLTVADCCVSRPSLTSMILASSRRIQHLRRTRRLVLHTRQKHFSVLKIARFQGWRFFIESQRTILAATTFVHDLDKEVKSGSASAWISQRMQELDNRIESVLLMRKGPRFLSQLSTAEPVDASEAVVARAMRSIAEIKLHR